jgi:VWA domain-containing protein
MISLLSLVLVSLAQFQDVSSQSLQQRIGERGLAADTRVRMLEELSMRNGALNYQKLESARSVARGQWLADYVRCLGRCGADAIPELRKYTRSRSKQVRAEAVYGLILADIENGEAFARKVLRDGKNPYEARVAALRGLADRGSILAHVEAVRRLANANGAVLLEAIDILARDPSTDDIRYLIDVVDQRTGRAQSNAVALLRQITGYKIGADARSWRYFFLKHRSEGTTFRRESDGEDGQDSTLSYMGIPIYGDKVVFVLDASGSMNAPLAESSRESRGRRAVKELSQLLPRLPSGARFDILFFESRISGFSGGRLVSNQPKQISSATDWIKQRRFDGGTNLFGGLEEAFSRPDVEEIVLLTDGMPSVGSIQEPQRILAWVQRWNRWRKVRISTIGLSAPKQADNFLYKLAHRNDGIYRSIF